MKPTRGFLIAKVEDKELKSGIVLLEDNNVSNKSIIVKFVHKDEKEFKKGDEIILANVQNLMGVKGKDDEEYIVISTSDICAVR